MSKELQQYRKYKTTLCRHWEETRECELGPLCSFAHGRSELRHYTDVSITKTPLTSFQPLPKDFNAKKDKLGAQHSNYKTQLCMNFMETGCCAFDTACVFAHGTDELRALIDPVPDAVPENLLFPPFKKA